MSTRARLGLDTPELRSRLPPIGWSLELAGLAAGLRDVGRPAEVAIGSRRSTYFSVWPHCVATGIDIDGALVDREFFDCDGQNSLTARELVAVDGLNCHLYLRFVTRFQVRRSRPRVEIAETPESRSRIYARGRADTGDIDRESSIIAKRKSPVDNHVVLVRPSKMCVPGSERKLWPDYARLSQTRCDQARSNCDGQKYEDVSSDVHATALHAFPVTADP